MPPRFQAISRISLALAWIALLGLPLAVLWQIATNGADGFLDIGKFRSLVIAPGLPAHRLWTALALQALSGLAMLFTLWRMIGLFAGFGRGEVISERTADHILGTGQGLTAVAALSVLSYPLQAVLLTLHNPPGERQLAVAFGSDELWFLIAGLMLVLIGWAMARAVALEEENRGFV